MRKKIEASVYWDLDGTLAKWNSAAKTEDLMKEGYFLNLDAERDLCGYADFLAGNGIRSKVLSAFLTDSQYAVREKLAWVTRNVPAIGDKGTFLVPCGMDKAAAVEFLKGRKLTKDDILVDDHSPNLIAWEKAGGTAVKWCNGINNSKRSSFAGPRCREPWEIESILKGLEVCPW